MNKIQREKALTWEREEAIEGIVTDLKKLSVTTEGLQITDRLKLKFWLDTQFVLLFQI